MRDFIQDAVKILPYGFVPVKGNEAELVTAQPFDDPAEGTYTGRIECTLRALSPLIPGNKQRSFENTKKKSRTEIQPLTIKGYNGPIISGHTLKGCIAAFLSAYLGIPMTRINDRRYTFRPNIRPEQGTVLRGYGIIKKITDRSIEVAQLDGPCGFCSIDNRKISIEVSTISDKKVQDYTYDKIELGMLKRLKETGGKSDKFCFFRYQDGLDGQGTFARTFSNKGKEHNYFAILAKNHPVGKTLTIFTIDKDTIDLYNKTLAALTTDEALSEHPQSKHPKFNADNIRRNMKATWPLKEGDIIFFEYKEGTTDVMTFGKHFRYRWAYKRTVGDAPDVGWVEKEFTKDSADKPHLSLLREMFGYSVAKNEKNRLSTEAYKRLEKDGLEKIWSAKSGKVRFNFATYHKGGTISPSMILPRPGSPRSTAYEFYVQQNMHENDSLPLKTYGDPVRDDFTTKHNLSGPKMYYKDADAEEHHAIQRENETDDFLVIALNPLIPEKRDGKISFPSFKFTVNFENLTKAELQLLVFALTLGPGNNLIEDTEDETKFKKLLGDNDNNILCHQIGYGKNYGMGAVQIAVDNLKCFQYKADTKEFVEEDVGPEHPIRSQIGIDRDRLEQIKPFLILESKKRSYPTAPDKNNIKTIPTWHTKRRNEDFKARRGAIKNKQN